ncbi:SDR family NAD(P)-dependent oxidoreductase [Marinicella sp. W31]|uniref:SDR family NAD(P)-dependent oxidoreductase n=1 Tax=Marinicella sp. W31 TaxID=3023713 RepID=UPI0037567C1D
MNIIIVGGERGIGQALVQQLRQERSHQLIITSRTAKLRADESLAYHPLDISDTDSIATFSQWTKSTFSHIDWVINCAGILHTDKYRPEKSLKQVNQLQLQDNFMTNAAGHLLLLKALEKQLAASSAGLATSISARIGSISDNKLGGWYAYRMSKAALNMAYKTLSIEWKRNYPQLKLLLFHPGTTATNLSAPFQKNVPDGKLHSVEKTARYYLEVIHDTLQQKQAALFRDYAGETITW